VDIFALTRRLIEIPSITGEEAQVGSYLLSYLRELGYSVETQQVDTDRFNLIAKTDVSPSIVLSTHMDTVPPFIPFREDNENIYGRGACDAKGIIASQIFATEKLRAAGINEVGLLFTVDEEMASLGAQRANDHPTASNCQYLINGEPTDNRLAAGTKGSLRVRITANGQAAHSAYPEQGESAIEKLLDVLERIRDCDWPTDEVFGETTCNIGVISGGTRPNVIAAEAQAELQIRLVTRAEPVKAMLDAAAASRARIDYLSAHDPVRLHTIDQFEQCVVRFTTDIPYLSRWGKPLLIGPGSILNAHTEHEQISKRELLRAVDLYVQLVHVLAADMRIL